MKNGTIVLESRIQSFKNVSYKPKRNFYKKSYSLLVKKRDLNEIMLLNKSKRKKFLWEEQRTDETNK